MVFKDRIYKYMEERQVELITLALLGFILLFIYEWGVFYPLSLKKVGALMWLAAIFLLRLEAAASLIAGFILLGLAAIISAVGKTSGAESLGIFIYLFLVIGVTQQLWEFLKVRGG